MVAITRKRKDRWYWEKSFWAMVQQVGDVLVATPLNKQPDTVPPYSCWIDNDDTIYFAFGSVMPLAFAGKTLVVQSCTIEFNSDNSASYVTAWAVQASEDPRDSTPTAIASTTTDVGNGSTGNLTDTLEFEYEVGTMSNVQVYIQAEATTGNIFVGIIKFTGVYK